MADPMTIKDVARQAARTVDGARHLGPLHIDQMADAVAVAVLREVSARTTARFTPSLNHGKPIDGLIVGGTVLREMLAELAPSLPETPRSEDDVTLALEALLNEVAIDVHGDPNAALDAKYALYTNALIKSAEARGRHVQPAETPSAPSEPRCPNCKGKGWVTPSIKMYPGDRVPCSCQKPPSPPASARTLADEAIEDARMGHVRLDECSGCPPGKLYDRISFVLQRASNGREESARKEIMVQKFIADYSALLTKGSR